ncbi:MAG: hypothetical protein WD426_00890 [Anditalea sp.]
MGKYNTDTFTAPVAVPWSGAGHWNYEPDCLSVAGLTGIATSVRKDWTTS